VNRERYDLPTWNLEIRHGLDHVFVTAFQWVHGREVLHSEGVALGTLIRNYLYDWRFEEAKAQLESCRVAFRPREIGCTTAEVQQVLARINELNDRVGHPQNWFHHRRLDGATFERMMARIEE
jgi:glycerol dehydrogenase-like iron-containing ADH family enzyme